MPDKGIERFIQPDKDFFVAYMINQSSYHLVLGDTEPHSPLDNWYSDSSSWTKKFQNIVKQLSS